MCCPFIHQKDGGGYQFTGVIISRCSLRISRENTVGDSLKENHWGDGFGDSCSPLHSMPRSYDPILYNIYRCLHF